MNRSYSTLSVDSARSSLTSDLQDTLKPPSVISNSEHPIETLSSEVRTSSPIIQDENTPIAQIKVENVDEPVINSESNLDAGLTVTDLQDEEFGNFVSISNEKPESNVVDTTGSRQTEQIAQKQELEEINGNSNDPALLSTNTDHRLEQSAEEATDSSNKDKGENPPEVLDQSTFKDTQEPGKLGNSSPVVDHIHLKGTGKVSTSKEKKQTKKERKEKAKKSRSKADHAIDDNQSEISYQPDTDLSRSKASKKVNGMLPLY